MPEDEQISELEELFYQGTDLHGERKYEEAMRMFDACLAKDSCYKDAILGKAMCYLAQENYEEAICLGRRLVEIDPDDILSYTNLSMFYQRAGMIELAEEAGARARVLDWKRRLAAENASEPVPPGTAAPGSGKSPIKGRG